MYENSRRAHRGQSIRDNHSESAQLYASFAQIAAGNLLAWNYGKPPATESSISEVSKRNRMINFPCEYNGSVQLCRISDLPPQTRSS